MSDGRKDDEAAQQEYEKQRRALQTSLDSQEASLIATNKDIADLTSQISDVEAHKGRKEADLEANNALNLAIYKDCSWVPQYFDSRRTKRQAEIEGLVEAKGYLARVKKETTGDETSVISVRSDRCRLVAVS